MRYLHETVNFPRDSLVVLLRSIRSYLYEHFESHPQKHVASDILKSRFTASEVAFDSGLISCGSITNIATDMLRFMGYSVKKIHWTFLPKTLDHAWIAIWSSNDQRWEEYDLTRQSCRISENHVRIAECDDWEEIRDLIEHAYERDLQEKILTLNS